MTTKKKNEQLPVLHNYGDDSGRGWEGQDQSDYQIPFLNQMQALSCEICGTKDEKVAGAECGMFINSVTKTIFSEVVLVPCMTKHTFVEWRPRKEGGGFVSEHAIDSPIVNEAKLAAAGDITKLRTAAGNELIDTFSIFAMLLDKPGDTNSSDMVVISFAKTKAKRYREIMTRLRTCKDARDVPLFAHQLRMVSTDEKNPAGDPYKNVKLTPAVDNDVLKSLLAPGHPVLEVARALQQSVVSGTARADFKSTGQEAPGSDDKHF